MTQISNEIGKPIIVVSVVSRDRQYTTVIQADMFPEELSIRSVRILERSRDGIAGTTQSRNA